MPKTLDSSIPIEICTSVSVVRYKVYMFITLGYRDTNTGVLLPMNKWGSTAYYYANYYKISVNQDLQTIIIESVDSISRDGPDMYIILYVIHYRIPNVSEQVNFKDF